MDFRGANTAFSLIELLVVIAIVGTLASLAVPIYSRYSLSARASSIIPVMNYLVDSSLKQQSISGAFANAYELGLTTTFGSQYATQANAVALNPYILSSSTSIFITDWNTQDSSFCQGKYGMVRITLDPSKLGLPSNYTSFSVECNFWNYNRTITKFCWYIYGGSGFVGTGNPIPNWLAATDASGTNVTAVRTAMNSFVNKNCP